MKSPRSASISRTPGRRVVTLPAGVSGFHFLLAVADGNKVVGEAMETNNVIARIVTIKP